MIKNEKQKKIAQTRSINIDIYLFIYRDRKPANKKKQIHIRIQKKMNEQIDFILKNTKKN